MSKKETAHVDMELHIRQFDDPVLYINRELSWLEFNQRVLDLAKDTAIPLLERVRFLCISSTNLDEFFEIRVAGLKTQIRNDEHPVLGPDGARPLDLFSQIAARAHAQVYDQYSVWNDILIPALIDENILFSRRREWNDEQKAWIATYFESQVLPVLSPVGLDPSHPFPRVLNKSLNFIVSVSGKDAFGRNSGVAIVQAPRSLPRIIAFPEHLAKTDNEFVFLSSVIHAHVEDLFPGLKVKGCHQFRVTRNSDLFVNEEVMVDLRIALESELFARRFGDAVRLEIADNCNEEVSQFMLNQFELEGRDLYQVNGPVNLNRLAEVVVSTDRPDLKYAPHSPVISRVTQPDIFDAIRTNDLLLHHPYQSFLPVVEFIKSAASDPSVLAIKMTLYRTDSHSLLSQALIDAARGGKEVTVVIELRARFDEQENIELSSALRDVGAHVVYGVVGYKTHAKLALVVRREDGEIRRYAHLGTGNYHPATARLYTDFGFFTCDDDICADVNDMLMTLTGLGKARKLRLMVQSPFTLADMVISKIETEMQKAKEGNAGRIRAKMNSLTDKRIIDALYNASSAGVKIELLIRGICSLRPGIPDISEHIFVQSMLGRFLEHSRVWVFGENDGCDVYLSSADWMGRNLFRRIEHAVPIKKKKLKKRIIKESFDIPWKNTNTTWCLSRSGEYVLNLPAEGEEPFSSQDHLIALHEEKNLL